MSERRGMMLLCAALAMACAGPLMAAEKKAAPRPAATKSEGPHTIVLTGGKVLTVSHGTIEHGVVVMSGGKITVVGAVGSVSVPKGAEVVDTAGMTVYPGLIDSETALGLVEVE
ncbi:MAG: amidohydrolase, partial [Acidobacteriaceae bacterium]|nr:amidohydrolase [Acidobacteriaceae bacterium]